MKKHIVKSHPKPFAQVWDGSKRHEIRINDRGYEQGDAIELREFNPHTKEYSGRSIDAVIGNCTHGGNFGLAADLCCFTLLHVHPQENL
jgi:hypothetical protein